MFTTLVGAMEIKWGKGAILLLFLLLNSFTNRVIVTHGDFTEYLTALYLTEISATSRFTYFVNRYFKYCI